MSKGSGGGTLPEWITALRGLARRIQAKGLVGAILSIVIPALISIFILQPLRYLIGFIEWGGTIVTEVFGIVERQLMAAFAPVRVAIVGSDYSTGVIDMVYSSVESGLMDAGLGAPFAATLTVVVFATVLTALLYVLLRVGADLVPGVGGLIR